MDNEFQWRSQMRKLNEAVEPARDLWPQIAARLAHEPQASSLPRRGYRHPMFAVAAALLVAVGAGLTAYRLDVSTPRSPAVADRVTPAVARLTVTSDDPTLTALDWAQPVDPKLAVAALTLDKANADLQAALEARPDAVFLVSMLNRTNAQRMRLMRQPGISG